MLWLGFLDLIGSQGTLGNPCCGNSMAHLFLHSRREPPNPVLLTILSSDVTNMVRKQNGLTQKALDGDVSTNPATLIFVLGGLERHLPSTQLWSWAVSIRWLTY